VISAIRIADITIYAHTFVSCSLRGFPAVTMHLWNLSMQLFTLAAQPRSKTASYNLWPWFLPPPRDVRTEVCLSILLMDADTYRHTPSLMSLQTRTRALRSSLRDARNQWKPFFTFTFDFQVKVSNVFMSLAPSPIFVYAVLTWFNRIPLQTHTHTNNHLTAFCPGLPG